VGSSEEIDSLKKLIQKYEKEIYDLNQLVEVAGTLCSTSELPALMESLLFIFMCRMHVLGAGIFVLDALDADEFKLDTNYTGIEPDRDVIYSIQADDPVIKLLLKERDVYTIEELAEQISGSGCVEMLSTLHLSLVVPLLLKNHLNGILVLGERIDLGESPAYTEYEKKQILELSFFASVAVNNAALVERSSTDMMTHLKHKYFFFNKLTDEMDAAVSQNIPLSVIMFDVDFFKGVNDTYGHAFGDYVLTSIASIILSNIRGKDLACRYGGEELTVMLYNTDKSGAMTVAERIRKQIEEYDFSFDRHHAHLSISGGVAVFKTKENPASSARELVDQADQGLYMAKRNGRNRIVFAYPGLVTKMRD